jgi:predicted GNAT family acetyltransferase
VTDDVTEYLARAGGLLRSQSVENTVLVTVAETLRVVGPDAFGDVAPVLGYWSEPDGEVTAAFLHTPPNGVALSTMPPRMAAELAGALADRGVVVSGIYGSDDVCRAFAGTWFGRTGQAARVGRRSRLHRLVELVVPDPMPSGRARLGTAADREVMVAWLEAFHHEVDPGPAREHGRVVDERLSYGGLVLWEAAGELVSLAGLNRLVAGQVRIGPVYTPPGVRRRGFGGAVTVAATQAALDWGADEVLLFTDLANPTSNALYQRLGYVPVSDRVELAFASSA